MVKGLLVVESYCKTHDFKFDHGGFHFGVVITLKGSVVFLKGMGWFFNLSAATRNNRASKGCMNQISSRFSSEKSRRSSSETSSYRERIHLFYDFLTISAVERTPNNPSLWKYALGYLVAVHTGIVDVQERLFKISFRSSLLFWNRYIAESKLVPF